MVTVAVAVAVTAAVAVVVTAAMAVVVMTTVQQAARDAVPQALGEPLMKEQPAAREAQRAHRRRGAAHTGGSRRWTALVGASRTGKLGALGRCGEGKFGARLYEPACDAVSPPRPSTRSAPNPSDGPARLAILRIAKRKTASTSAIDFIRRSDCVQKGYLSEQ